MSDEHVRRKYVVENTWKCNNCQHVNPGRDLKCAGCGAPKDNTIKDAVDAEAAPEVTDEKLLGMANAGENYVCPFCKAQGRPVDGKCRNCGSRAEEGRERLPDDPPPQNQASPPQAAPKKTHYALIGGVAFLVLAAVVCFVPRAKKTHVQSLLWEYQVDLKQKTLSHGSGFSHPSDAFNLSCQQRQDGTHDCDPYKCNPHTEKYDCHPHDCKCHKVTKDKKNGFSEVEEHCETCYDKCDKQVEDTCYHQCPTYKEWCSYDFYDWPTVGTQKLSGTDHNTRWPSLAVRDAANQRLEKKETYKVTFADDKKSYPYEPKGLDEFKKYSVGAAWKIKVTTLGSVTPDKPE